MASHDPRSTSTPSAADTLDAPAAAQPVDAFDLDAYLRRIGFTHTDPGADAGAPAAAPAPTLETLRTIARLHPAAIPFENVNPLLRWPVELDAASLQQKLVRDGRGGWCFEQNGLLMHALRAIGFTVTGLAGRVVWNQSDEAITARTHMILRVEVEEGSRIVDVGFGGMTLTGPMTLDLDVEQATPHEPFRITRRRDDLLLQVRLAGEWKPLYRFTLQEQFPIDYVLANWYLCTHPDSHFLQGLIVARAGADRRYALRNNQLSEHILGRGTVQRTFTTAADLRAAIEGPLGLRLPTGRPELDETLERLASATPPSTA